MDRVFKEAENKFMSKKGLMDEMHLLNTEERNR